MSVVSVVSRGVLPTVVRRCVWSRNLVNEEALAHKGLLRQMKEKVSFHQCSVLLRPPITGAVIMILAINIVVSNTHDI